MSFPTIQTAVNAGELSPDMWGRTDLDKYRHGCSTLRNFFASYRGGAYSRAGTLFVGQCKQGNKGQAQNVSPPRNMPFQFSVTQGITIEAGDNYFRFVSDGAYITEATTTISGITQANPGVITDNGHGYSNGDEAFLTRIGGMTQLNGQSFEVANVTTNTYTLVNVLTGAAVDTRNYTAYTSGGTAARIYTLATPYAAIDLPYLKTTESADVMTLCCLNQVTGTEYASYDLARITANDWTLTKTTYASSIGAPASATGSQTNTGTGEGPWFYNYVFTAVDAITGEESVASPVAFIGGASVENISINAGTNIITGAGVTGAGSYNFYRAPEQYGTASGAGSIFGFIGTSFGPTFSDSNVEPDYTASPPTHQNPFATSSILNVVMKNYGASYSPTATTAAAISPTGTGAVLIPIVIGGEIQWTAVSYGGQGYTSGDKVNFTDATGSGSGASASLNIGPLSGLFPSAAAYFQERRFYANSRTEPDTYWASQPGAFTNMDTSIPTKDDDAIIGSPWAQQVNGIQWMINMPGGLVIFTGLGAWQLSGGSFGAATASALTPSNQVANPQAYNGCSPTVRPIVVNYDILYVQEKGSIVRDLSYNFFVNIYTGTDLTVLSNHLFDGYTIVQWDWAEEPYKLIWTVRDDGILLCLTYLKEQDVYSWSRHDTNGLYQSVAVVSEPPVNAPYFIVKRLIQNDGEPVWAYFQERMDNRVWRTQEDSWCVDAGLSYEPTEPAAVLTASSSAGIPTLQQPTLIYGGANYSAQTYGEIVDSTGVGAIPSITIGAGGVITAASVSGTLVGYTNPTFNVIDPQGLGGNAAINILSANVVTFESSPGIFANAAGEGQIGDVIRMGDGLATVTTYGTSASVTASVTRPIMPTMQDDALDTPVPAASGEWSIGFPITTVTGLNHLEGMLVSCLADGVVIEPQIVVNGSITILQPATKIVAGLGFTAQLQTLYLDIQGAVTVQGRRTEIDSVVVRLVDSGQPFDMGTNQPDAATQPGAQNVPWQNMTANQTSLTGSTPLQPFQFFTGDIFADVNDQPGMDKAQAAFQQTNPVPLNILACVIFSRIQDDVDSA